MDIEEFFVGAVAIAVGVLALAVAVRNPDWCYQFHKIRWIEARCGRGGARLFYALLGAALIVLGMAIARGYGPNKGAPPEKAEKAAGAFLSN